MMAKLPSTPFVNRQQELGLIRKKLQIIQEARYLFSFILTVSGVPGIGKTYLLQQSQREAEAQAIRTLFVDYEDNAAWNNPLFILQNIADSFFKPATDWQQAVMEYQEHQGHPSQQAFYQGQVAQVFIQNLQPVLEERPFLLLLDNSHLMSEVGQEILEEVLERLYHDSRRLLVILAGRSDLRWHSFELRRRTTPLTLGTFPKDESDELWLKLGYDTLKDQVYAVTRGYPKATVLTSQWVADHLISDSRLSNNFDVHEKELVFELFNKIFEKYILGDIKNSEIQQRLSRLLRYVSPLRRFDDHLLADLLEKLDKENFEQVSALDARAYTRQMTSLTYLVKWDSKKQAYALDEPMRRLLSLELKFRDKSLLMQIHKFAMNWYQEAIDNVTLKDPSASQSVVYLLEQIFHWVQLRKLEDKMAGLETEIQEKISELFKGYYPREQARFQELFSQDEDLAELLGQSYQHLKTFLAKQGDLETHR